VSCFSPDGSIVAAASADSRIRLVEVATGRVVAELAGHEGPVTALTFFPDGHALASGGVDGSIRFWDVKGARETARLKDTAGGVLALSITYSGVLLASSSFGEHSIRIWDTGTLEPKSFLRSDGANATCLNFRNELGALVSGDDVGNVTLWNLAIARPRVSFQAHRGWIKSLTVALHGQVLATGGNDGLVKVWDLNPIFKVQ